MGNFKTALRLNKKKMDDGSWTEVADQEQLSRKPGREQILAVLPCMTMRGRPLYRFRGNTPLWAGMTRRTSAGEMYSIAFDLEDVLGKPTGKAQTDYNAERLAAFALTKQFYRMSSNGRYEARSRNRKPPLPCIERRSMERSKKVRRKPLPGQRPSGDLLRTRRTRPAVPVLSRQKRRWSAMRRIRPTPSSLKSTGKLSLPGARIRLSRRGIRLRNCPSPPR